MEVTDAYCITEATLKFLEKEVIFKVDESSLHGLKAKFTLSRKALEGQSGLFRILPEDMLQQLVELKEQEYPHNEEKNKEEFLRDIKKAIGVQSTRGYEHEILERARISRDKVPSNLVKKLKNLIDQEYRTEAEFLNALQSVLGEDSTMQYQSQILKHAQRNLPQYIFTKLESLKNRQYDSKKRFLADLEKILGGEKLAWYQTKILEYTHKQEIKAKIVYYGPAFSGKTTSLHWLYAKLDPQKMNEFFSLDTEGDCTLFFDLLPLDLGKVEGRDIRVKLYTVPGQVKYEKTRKMVLTGADAVVFVADSGRNRHKDNIESLKNLAENLMVNKLNIRTLPLVLQYNKRDLSDIHSIEFMDQKLNFRNLPAFGSAAIDHGDNGVLKCFIAVLKSMVESLADKLQIEKTSAEIQNMKSDLEKTLWSSAHSNPI